MRPRLSLAKFQSQPCRSGQKTNVLGGWLPSLTLAFGMSPNIQALASFLERADADRAQKMLETVGIASAVRSIDDIPHGHRIVQQEGFILWVERSEFWRATEVYQELMMAAFPPQFCSRCGRNHATVHITTISGGRRLIEDICGKCHSAGDQS